MTRYVHYIGSLPVESAAGDRAVLEWFVDHAAGSPVTAVPCDFDPDWIVSYLRGRAAHTDVLELVRAGEFQGYSDMPTYRLRSGRRLEPQHVSMDRVARIGEVVSAFASLQPDRPTLTDTKVQLSQPNPLDLAMFVFAAAAVTGGLPVLRALRRSNLVVRALRELTVFTDAVLREVTDVVDRHGDRVVWQVESPIALLGMVKAEQLRSQWALGPLIARQLAGFLGRMHDVGARTTVHLCYGDLQHESLLRPHTLAPAVTLLNRMARLLDRQGTPFPPVHVPCAFGAEPAPLHPDFYAPLRRLDPRWQVIAGVVSPTSADDSARALTLLEEALGRTAYGVATACGLGRCTVEAADRAATTTAALAAGQQ